MADHPSIEDKNRYLKLMYFASAAVYVVLCTLAFRIDWSIGVLPVCYGICYYVLLAVTNSTLSIGAFAVFKVTIAIYASIFGILYMFLHFDSKTGWTKGGDNTFTVISAVFASFFAVVASVYFHHFVQIDNLERRNRVRNVSSPNPFERIVIKERPIKIFDYAKWVFLVTFIAYVLMSLASIYFVGWYSLVSVICGSIHYALMAISLFFEPYRLCFIGAFVVFKGVISFLLVLCSFTLMALLHKEMALMITGAVIAWLLIVFFLFSSAYFYRCYLFIEFEEKGLVGPHSHNEIEMAEKEPMIEEADPNLGAPFPHVIPSAPPPEF